jgi:hypothetical protein
MFTATITVVGDNFNWNLNMALSSQTSIWQYLIIP